MDQKKRQHKRTIQFQDWIAKMYPELKPADADEDDKRTHLVTKNVTFQVTDRCSLACTYCYQINKGKRVMSWETAKMMVDKVISGEDGFAEYLDGAEAIILEFIGGEPLLEVGLIDKIVDRFRERTIELGHPWATRYCISICSNGVAYRDEAVQKFLNKNRGSISFSVTVDGTKELHDACRVFPDGSPSYDIAHDAAMDWMRRGNHIGSKITMAPSNIKYFSECLKQMLADGYDEINANVVFEEGWTLEHAQEEWRQAKEFADWFRSSGYDQEDYYISFFEQTIGRPMEEEDDKNWCGGNGAMLACDPDGDLYPCIRYMGSSLGCSQKPLKIGDVKNGIMQRSEERDIVKCLSCISRRSQSTDECFYCPIAQGCAWCSGYNYQVHGTADKRCTFICDMHKARVLASVYYWNHYFHENGRDSDVIDLWVPEQWAVPIIGKEEYEALCGLTLSMGGKVNRDKTIVHEKPGEEGVFE